MRTGVAAGSVRFGLKEQRTSNLRAAVLVHRAHTR
jgi:hypothetical protein